jgi:hypothetical protein
MTDRDRLIELLKQATTLHLDYLESIDQKGLTDTEGKAKFIADHLLANGVIVQKQGEWKKTEEPLGWQDVDCVECSVCHETWILDEDFDFEFCKEMWKYCPNCGVKMKEREGK